MLGAIVGDIVGSPYEFYNTKSPSFELLTPQSYFTDDSVMTLAVAKCLIEDEAHTIHYLIYCMQELGSNNSEPSPIFLNKKKENSIQNFKGMIWTT